MNLADVGDVRKSPAQQGQGQRPAAGEVPGPQIFLLLALAPDMDMRPVGETIRLIQDAGFEVLGVEAMREHYARTIRAWLENFEANLPAITYTWTRTGGSLSAGSGRLFVAQTNGNQPHPSSGDTWTVTYTTGGQSFTQSGSF